MVIDLVSEKKRIKERYEQDESLTGLFDYLTDKYPEVGDPVLGQLIINAAISSDRDITRTQLNYLFHQRELIDSSEKVNRKFKTQNRSKIDNQE